MSLKSLISSPLEAGPSVLDAHRLPSHLDAALEYASRRLARRNLSIDLVVIRRQYQLPGACPEAESSCMAAQQRLPAVARSSSASTDDTLIRDLADDDSVQVGLPFFPQRPAQAKALGRLPRLQLVQPVQPPATRSRFTSAIKSLVRSSTLPSHRSAPHPAVLSVHTASPHRSPSLGSPCSHHYGSSVDSSATGSWPFSPASSVLPSPSSASAYPSTPSTPGTPATPALTVDSSSGTSAVASAVGGWRPSGHADSFIRLVHADGLMPKEERQLHQALDKAARKFHLCPHQLTPPVAAHTLGLPDGFLRASVEQNEMLLAGAGGLRLRSADHLYTFKAALCSYAQTGDRFRLEDAVDELRRYVLARGGRRLAKRALLRNYPTLRFAESDLADVRHMYSRAYGGVERDCGIEADGLSSCPLDDGRSATMFLGGWLDGSAKEEGRSEVEAEGENDEIENDENDEEQTTPTATTASACSPSTLSSLSSLFSLSLATPSVVLGLAAQQRRRQRKQQLPLDKEAIEEKRQVDGRQDDSQEAAEEPTSWLEMDDEDEYTESSKREDKLLESGGAESRLVIVAPLPPQSTAVALASGQKSPLLPVLRLQTTFDNKGRAGHGAGRRKIPEPAPAKAAAVVRDKTRDSVLPIVSGEEEEEEEQLTARPDSHSRRSPGGSGNNSNNVWWAVASIGEMLQEEWNSRRSGGSGGSFGSPGGCSAELVPPTPNRYDDISPITRSEWGFLMGGQQGRQVAVTTTLL